MAELNTGGGNSKGKKVRSKKQNSGVDLTAMVDLAFLLITFFMLTTSMNKPQSMNLAMPEKAEENTDDITEIAESRTMTILLGGDNKIAWYMGKVESPFEGPKDQVYGKDGIRLDIQAKVKSVPLATKDPKKGVIVIIKPSEKSNYRNLVDILDEMAINDVKAYAISEITPEELSMLGEN